MQLLRREEFPQPDSTGWSQRVHLDADSSIYGLGERTSGLNLRPGSYRLWNMNAGGTYAPGQDPIYITMPVYVCIQNSGACLAFYDNTFDGQVEIDRYLDISFTAGPARVYLSFGSLPRLIENLTALTGRPPLPSLWALGYHQSQWGYQNETELRRIYAGFTRNNLPISVLVMDIDHLKGYRTLTLAEDRFPSLREFSEELSKDDVHLVTNTNPSVKMEPGFDLYDAGLQRGAFCRLPDGKLLKGVVWPGWSVFPDFTKPEVRSWWGENYQRHLRHGIDGFWHDMNEPENFVGIGDPTIPLATQHYIEGRHGDHREVHNVYGMLHNRAAYEGLRKLRHDKRPFIISRSGWVGMQRYSWSWTGDVETSWGIMRQTIGTVLGLGLCGMPYSGSDIGGFSGAPSAELFVRWFQLCSWMPFFRTHSAFFLPAA